MTANMPLPMYSLPDPALEKLVEVVRELSHARGIDDITRVVRTAARALTGADGATFVLRDVDKCHYADEDAISPLWKGQRFPMKHCISGWVMLNAQPAVIEDIYADPRIPAEAYRPTFVKSLAMVPIRRESPVGAIGNYWASRHKPTTEQVTLLQALADVASVAIENVNLYTQLQEKIVALEQANETMGRFVWIASHDLKSPLRAIDNLSQWIEEDLGPALQGESRENFTRLRRRVTRMERLLEDTLSYAQMDAGTRQKTTEIVSGAALADEVLLLVDLPQGFTVEWSTDFMSAMVPRLPLLQVFCNLIDNAIKHHDRKKGHVSVDVETGGAQYTFRVTDDGPGIPEAFRQKVFEMFQTLKPRDTAEGSGMGLAFVKKMLSMHNCEISVTDAKPRGAVFSFTWPRPLNLPE